MSRPAVDSWMLGAVLAAGTVALGGPWLEAVRPRATPERADRVIRVTRTEDGVSGSLHWAILEADRSRDRVRIEFDVPSLEPREPLPAVIGEASVILAGPVLLDARRLPSDGPVLDLGSRESRLVDVEIRSGWGAGVRARRGHVTLQRVVLAENDTGVEVGPEVRLDVDASTFTGNDVGLRWEAGGDVRLAETTFRGHRRTAIWAVRGVGSRGSGRLDVQSTRFLEDRVAIVARDAPLDLRSSSVVGALDAGLRLEGTGARVRNCRLRDGPKVAIEVTGGRGVLLESNEIDGWAAGLVLQGSSDTIVARNRLHRNVVGVAAFSNRDTRFEENLFLLEDGQHAWDPTGAAPEGDHRVVRTEANVPGRESHGG